MPWRIRPSRPSREHATVPLGFPRLEKGRDRRRPQEQADAAVDVSSALHPMTRTYAGATDTPKQHLRSISICAFAHTGP
jgi:hypothetical protein